MEKFGVDEAVILSEALRKLDRLAEFTTNETNGIKEVVNDVIVSTHKMAEIVMSLVEENGKMKGELKVLEEQNDKLHLNIKRVAKPTGLGAGYRTEKAR